jgi:hypothetical protein
MAVAGSMDSKKASIVGCAVGALLSLLSILLLEVSDVTLLGAYALLMLLLSAALTSSERAGAYFGLFAFIGECVTDFAYFLMGGVQMLLVPYAVGLILFVGRIPVFPLLGAIGGYFGRQYFTGKTKPRSRAADRKVAAQKSRAK